MELDEMKLAWQALDARLEHQHALSLQLFRDSRLNKLRRGLRPLVWGQAIRFSVGVLCTVMGGWFWTTHLHPLHLLICGLLVHAFGLLWIAFSTRNFALISRVDYAAPVLEIQKRLAALRAFRARVEAPVDAVLCCFVWIPVTWMALAWSGIDLWSRGLLRWAVASSLVGLGIVLFGRWLLRRMGRGRWMDDNAAGRSVQRAEAVLNEVMRFERT